MKTAGVRRLLHISVVVARPDPALPYHDTKWKGEELVRASGLDWTILRPGVIYGLGDDLLAHLSLMLRIAPVFPIVNDGRSPMMPVHAGDVAKGVVGALRHPETAGKTVEIVGPERLVLRDVVRRVAEAMGLPVWIWPTPIGLMKIPVSVMEATMTQPLSTRAQLAMLVEGLAGDPGPARQLLGLETLPFTAERLRPAPGGGRSPAPAGDPSSRGAGAVRTFRASADPGLSRSDRSLEGHDDRDGRPPGSLGAAEGGAPAVDADRSTRGSGSCRGSAALRV